MNASSGRFLCGAGALAAVLLGASVASASISNIIFEVQATNASGSGTLQIPFAAGTFNPAQQTLTWVQAAPMQIVDPNNNNVIAVLNNANVFLRDLSAVGDPQINMGFAVTAGDSQTTFNIKSAFLQFNPISAALSEGQASAALGVTDANGTAGATIEGIGPPGTGIYTAQYNGFVPGGTTFSNLIALVNVGTGGSNSASANDPAFGFNDIPVAVSSMSAALDFTLTAGDLANGTTGFRIVPEPATLWLLAAGLGAVSRRRR